MEVDHQVATGGPPQDKMMFCGNCFSDCRGRATFAGDRGRWQAYGDVRNGEKWWIFLCQRCSRGFWRLYSKCEDFPDYHTACEEYMLFLKDELSKST
jgi:hypothetical protein